MQNADLAKILDQIYAKPGNPRIRGDGKLGTAVREESSSGTVSVGRDGKSYWHLNDAVEQLVRLGKLLEADKESGGKLLTPEERAIALAEAKELFDAIQSPDVTGNVGKELAGNKVRSANVKRAMRKVMRNPALKSVTGAVFEDVNGKVKTTYIPRVRGVAGLTFVLEILPIVDMGIILWKNGGDLDATLDTMCELMCPPGTRPSDVRLGGVA